MNNKISQNKKKTKKKKEKKSKNPKNRSDFSMEKKSYRINKFWLLKIIL